MSHQAVRVGLCGLGTVGSGVVNLFNRSSRVISHRCGARVELTHVADARRRWAAAI